MSLSTKEYLKGIDLEKPAGVMFFFDEGSDEPDVLAFIPVTNLEDLLTQLAHYAEVDENDGITSITPSDGPTLLVKQQGDVAFISNKAEQLKELPANPSTMLGDMPSKYNLAARIYGQRIPQSICDQIMSTIREGMESSLAQMDDDIADIQRKNIELQMKQMESLIKETKEVEAGFAIDEQKQNLSFDVHMTGESDSKLARQIAAARSVKPRFSGFLIDGAAFSAHVCSKAAAEDADYTKSMMSDARNKVIKHLDESDHLSAEESSAAKDLVKSFFEVLDNTLDKGDINMGLVGTYDGKALNAALAIQLADPQAMQKELDRAIKLIQAKVGDKMSVKMNATKNQYATFQEIDVALPEDNEKPRKVFGDQLKLNFGLSSDAAYLTLGDGGLELLNKAMSNSKSNEKKSLSEMNVYLAQILHFASTVADDEHAGELLGKMADKLAEGGKDRISITTDAIENGMKMRFEIEDGFLESIGMAIREFSSRGFGGNDF